MKRNSILRLSLLGIVALCSVASAPRASAQTQTQQARAYDFELMKLPYATDALEPAIGRQTVELHHGKHLQAYVSNLNRLKRGTAFEAVSDLIAIVKQSRGSIFDNAGQILNHNLYFSQFSPRPRPLSGALAQAIVQQWGSEQAFRSAFEQAGLSLFGSGWLWLVSDKSGKLSIVKEPNGSNPVVSDLVPLLGVDLWEHAYYLDYQNKRADHLKALWQIVDWAVVEARYSNR